MNKNKKSKFKSMALSASAIVGVATIGLTSLGAASAATTTEPTIQTANTTIKSNNQGLTIYADPQATQSTGKQLATNISDWRVTREAKDTSGNVIAYDLGNGQWVKASDLQQTTGNSNQGNATTKTANGILINSNYQSVQIYSNAKATQPNGRLSTQYNLWQVFEIAYDKTGTPTAYRIGANQWVKATDVTVATN